MTYIDALTLGLLQGITEFLPISSTGHLALAHNFLGIETTSNLAFDATLHFATALAILIYFRKDFIELLTSFFKIIGGRGVEHTQKVLIYGIILATIPAAVFGLLFEEKMDTIFGEPKLVAWMLIFGSLLFLYAERKTKKIPEHKELTVKTAIVIGFFQILSLLQGMSRSGSTISGGMIMGLTREEAARFAFLLSVPIIFGAGSLKLLELSSAGVSQNEWQMIGVASLVAFTSGLLSIHYLLRFLKKHTLHVFVAYRIILAFIVFLFI